METVALSTANFTQINLKAKEESLSVHESTQQAHENSLQLLEDQRVDLGAKEEQRFDIREESADEAKRPAKGKQTQSAGPKKTPK